MEKNTRALILIDLQNDFFPGGSLPVSEANQVFPIANEVQSYFSHIIASKDHHPATHKSFAAAHPGKQIYDVIELGGVPQVLWPVHCVQDTIGSEFHPTLNTKDINKIIYKGTDPEIDSYSAFFDNAHQKNTGLDDYLKEQGITELYIMGLATDYCVQYSVLDARQLGYKVFLIEDGCYGVENTAGDVQKAIDAMVQAGAILIKSTALRELNGT